MIQKLSKVLVRTNDNEADSSKQNSNLRLNLMNIARPDC